MKITSYTPDTSLTFKSNEVTAQLTENFMYRVVSLPSGRVFVIGGAKDINGQQTLKDTHEVVDGQFNKMASMWISRAAFGVAVYPNFTQIFIAGGRLNSTEATKHCERYIVSQNVWKRLPELREAKFSTSLCFFNNGGTLYCFGGLVQDGPDQLVPTASIERLSKGQNNWQLLNLKIPRKIFDLGAMQINSSSLILFGGFESGPKDEVFVYHTGPDDGSFDEIEKLQTPDFFVQNGVFIKVPGEQQQLIFNGHTHMHLFDQQSMTFKTLPTQ